MANMDLYIMFNDFLNQIELKYGGVNRRTDTEVYGALSRGDEKLDTREAT